MMRWLGGGKRLKALVGVEPTMADLQSAALASWLQRRMIWEHIMVSRRRQLEVGFSAMIG
jgi:hypothetical protein